MVMLRGSFSVGTGLSHCWENACRTDAVQKYLTWVEVSYILYEKPSNCNSAALIRTTQEAD